MRLNSLLCFFFVRANNIFFYGKEVNGMILFSILAIILAILTVIAITVLVIGGAAGFVIFGDLIVCIALIVLLMRFITKRKRK